MKVATLSILVVCLLLPEVDCIRRKAFKFAGKQEDATTEGVTKPPMENTKAPKHTEAPAQPETEPAKATKPTKATEPAVEVTTPAAKSPAPVPEPPRTKAARTTAEPVATPAPATKPEPAEPPTSAAPKKPTKPTEAPTPAPTPAPTLAPTTVAPPPPPEAPTSVPTAATTTTSTTVTTTTTTMTVATTPAPQPTPAPAPAPESPATAPTAQPTQAPVPAPAPHGPTEKPTRETSPHTTSSTLPTGMFACAHYFSGGTGIAGLDECKDNGLKNAVCQMYIDRCEASKIMMDQCRSIIDVLADEQTIYMFYKCRQTPNYMLTHTVACDAVSLRFKTFVCNVEPYREGCRAVNMTLLIAGVALFSVGLLCLIIAVIVLCKICIAKPQREVRHAAAASVL